MGKTYPAYHAARIDCRIPAGQDGVWAAVRKLRAFTVAEIEAVVDADKEHIADYLRRLERGGFLRLRSTKPVQYQLFEDQAETPRVRHDGTVIDDPRGRGQDNMWRAAKMLRDFDAADIAQAAACDGVKIAVGTAKQYLGWLFAAGYLIQVQEPRRSGKRGVDGMARYALDPRRNSGPRAPRIMRAKAVFDPNDGRIYGLPDPAEQIL